jgi:hypothetical protein
MDDNELWLSLREALNYIANESDQAHEAALKLVGDSGESGSGNEKFESDVVEADLVTWGTSKPPEQAHFSGPPAPYQIHLALLGAATEAFKEGARRGIRCRGTHPVNGNREDIEFGDWPVLIIPVEAAFNDKGEVLKEEKGKPIVFYEGVTVYWPDLARQFPRPSPPAPPPVPTTPFPAVGAPGADESTATEESAGGETTPAVAESGIKRGRRQYGFWPEVEDFIFDLLVHHGSPSPDDPELPNQQALEVRVATFMQQNGWDAAESTIREHVVGMLEHWGKLGR